MKRRIGVVSLLLVLIVLAGLGVKFYAGSGDKNVYSGTIEGTAIPVQPEQGGRIVELPVREGQDIRAGEIVAKLDDSQAVISLAMAKSQLAQAQAKLNDLLSGAQKEEIRRFQAVLAQAQATAKGLAQNLTYEENNLANYKKLYETGAISKQALDAQQNKYDNVKTQYESALANVAAAQASLDQALAGTRENTIQAQKAGVDMAAQSVQAAELNLTKLTIKSPISGKILYRHVEPGQVVAPGTTLVTIVDPQDLWIKIFVPETKLSQVKTGGSALIKVDTYPDRTFKGQIQYISDQAEFTPKNVQTKEERTTTVYAVKIVITEGADMLKIGMPADVTLQ